VTRDVAASVRQRLMNRAKAEGRPFNQVLQHFALERFLYRLGCSAYQPKFVLKGALMFTVWQSPFLQPTRDIDLLGRMVDTVESVVAAIKEICQALAPEDGLRFDAESVAGERIVETGQYQGVRVRFTAYLGRARVPMQIDIGFGDALVPGPVPVRLPTILDLPPPELQGYSRESTVAEKFQAMVYLGEVNSRMKDFYDIWFLAMHFPFDGPLLARAVQETFRRRGTALSPAPVAFSQAFANDDEKQIQWVAFVRRHQLKDAPATLGDAVQGIAAFLQPVTQALAEGYPFDRQWPLGGPWSPPI
jgi:hypothetical protein